MKPSFIPHREPEAPRIHSFVRARRRANRLTQREMAELAGVGVRLVSELERGKRTLRMDAVNKVLHVFGKELGIVESSRGGDRAGQGS